MKIPQSFYLGGCKVTVEVVEDLVGEEGAYGMFRPHGKKIQLCENIPEDQLQQTLCHELTHAILHTMGHELWDDEQFVDLFGTFLHQFLTSQKGTISVETK